MENLEKFGAQKEESERYCERENSRIGRKFLGRVEAWAHSRELETARVEEVRGEREEMGWSGAPEESSSASTRYQALLKVHKHREVKRELWPWLAVN